MVSHVGPQTAREGKATAYVCENRVCEAPTQDPVEFRTALESKPASFRNKAGEN